MPYIFTTKYNYKDDEYQIEMAEAITKFPFLAGKTVSGEVLAASIDDRVVTIRRPIKFRVSIAQEYYNRVGTVSHPNPLEERGIPPCELLLALYKYDKMDSGKAIEFPIAEGEIIRGTIRNYFEDISKKLSKEEEIRIILETTTFHHELAKSTEVLRDAYISFSEGRYPDAKTACRRILESLKNLSENWKTIDQSESLCEKFTGMLKSMYSFASPGGPHPGITTRDETELILKTVATMDFYVNSILKGGRITLKGD